MGNEPGRGISGADVTTPNIARIYDYFLGGSANFAVDREAGQQFLRAFPRNVEWSRINRSFLGRAVRYLCTETAVDQFLDLGSGVPTVGNVHEIAQIQNPTARVVYVDIEPVAVHHARHLLEGNERATAIEADIRDPQAVLKAAGGWLDFGRPVAVLAVAIFDLLELADPAGLVATYRDACVPGSALVLSHTVPMDMSESEITGVAEVMQQTTTPDLQYRTYDDIAALFPGYQLVAPGLVPSAQWQPEQPVSEHDAARSNGYAGLGLLR